MPTMTAGQWASLAVAAVPAFWMVGAYNRLVALRSAIGSAFLAHLQADPRCALAVGLGRHTSPVIDLDDEATIAAAAQQLKAQGPWHSTIHAAGMLHGPQGLPEQRMAQLHYAQTAATSRTTTSGTTSTHARSRPRRLPWRREFRMRAKVDGI
mgnify:CR=1 FL=1